MSTKTTTTPSNLLSIDIETRSTVDLIEHGVYVYTADPEFDILLFAYAYGDDPVEVIELGAGQEMPRDLLEALTDPAVKKCAHNANFERTCLAKWLGVPMDPAQWECTMVRCREAGLPGGLKMAGVRLGLTQEQRKQVTGNRLIKLFCVPEGPTLLNGQSIWNNPWDFPDEWAKFVEYNRQDVVAERELRKMLPGIHPREQALWEVDQEINDRGVRIDRPFVENAVMMKNQTNAVLAARALKVTGLANPNSPPQLKAWLREQLGHPVRSIDKNALPELAAQGNEAVRELVELRQQMGKSSLKKYDRMIEQALPDGRIHGLTKFYGAGTTGRWSGSGVQIHNLPRNKMEDLDTPRRMVQDGDWALLDETYPSVPHVLSELIRTALIPAEGCRFIISDFSSIEARVIAWLADEKWRLDVFRKGGKLYETSASMMFGVPVERIVKGNPEYDLRARGKVAELALGYNGGPNALINMGALEMGLHEEELPALVAQWRKASPRIKALWSNIEKAARHVIKTGRKVAVNGARDKLAFSYSRRDLAMRAHLPSGRCLVYRDARINAEDRITYAGTDEMATTKQAYGGKLTENVVQAIARDCLGESMKLLTMLGFDIVFHVHDEVIIEAPNGFSSADEVARIMSTPVPWAPDIPLAAAAFESSYYRKD